MDAPRIAKKNWDPDSMLDEIMLESQYDQHDAAASVARRLREHGMIAAESMAHLATHAGNEKVRMDASKYIIEKVLTGGFDHDRRLEEAQKQIMGQAMYALVRALGLEFNFDPESTKVKAIAHETILAVAAGELGTGEAA
jgi:hypothetical protein